LEPARGLKLVSLSGESRALESPDCSPNLQQS
jgi:hypothetical protein